MLLRKKDLDRIVTGEVDLVFRRWKRPTVRTGGTLRTPAGVLEIVDVEPVSLDSLTDEDARRAGLDLPELLDFLTARDDGDVYRVVLGSVAPDPRVTLREQGELTDEEVDVIHARLGRFDRSSRRGPWTHEFLRLIDSKPHVRAQDLADELGLERLVFKNDVRKLKELGLTISHSPGYELSPRGRAYLARARG